MTDHDTFADGVIVTALMSGSYALLTLFTPLPWISAHLFVLFAVLAIGVFEWSADRSLAGGIYD